MKKLLDGGCDVELTSRCLWFSAGVGRTGTFMALDRLMQHIREHEFADILGMVSEMRSHRLSMVQTEVSPLTLTVSSSVYVRGMNVFRVKSASATTV